MLVVACAAAPWCAVSLTATSMAQAGAITVAGAWHRAIEVPGTGALNKGGFGDVQSVSCGSAGNCAAVGDYAGGSDHPQVFVASELDGTWRTAIEIPGTSALNKDGMAGVQSVSCASAGNCLAGGYYTDGAGHRQAFVASEQDGTWQPAIEVPGTGALNKGGIAEVTSVSCASAGNCAAGGTYTDAPDPSDHTQVFVAGERNGTWQPAIEIPGSGALNAGGFASVTSVSCGSEGNCAAGGSYLNSAGGRTEAFVDSEQNGTWRTAIEVPGSSVLNKGFGAAVTSVSCASAGNCAAGGTYNGPGYIEAFVASERDGSWRTAIEVPGTGALNKDGGGGVASVSCASAGNCLAGGYYRDSSDNVQAFVASERDGSWRTAIEVPGAGTLNEGGIAGVYSVSCASAGQCAVGGGYEDSSGHGQAFVASQT
jgi:hypothetical protein